MNFLKKKKCFWGYLFLWNIQILYNLFQVIRRPFYGKKPVQTVQRPGEIVYVPGTSPYAFYNVDRTTVDIFDAFFGIGNLEILSSIPDLDSWTEKVLAKVASVEDRKRILGIAKQIKEHRISNRGMNFDGETMSE